MRQYPVWVPWKYAVGCLQPCLWPLPPAWAPRAVALPAATSPAAPGCILVPACPLAMAAAAHGPCYQHQLHQLRSALRNGARGWGHGLHWGHLCPQVTHSSGAATAAWHPDCRDHHIPEMPCFPWCILRCCTALGKAARWPCLQQFLRLPNLPQAALEVSVMEGKGTLLHGCIATALFVPPAADRYLFSLLGISVLTSLLMDRHSVPHCFGG